MTKINKEIKDSYLKLIICYERSFEIMLNYESVLIPEEEFNIYQEKLTKYKDKILELINNIEANGYKLHRLLERTEDLFTQHFNSPRETSIIYMASYNINVTMGILAHQLIREAV